MLLNVLSHRLTISFFFFFSSFQIDLQLWIFLLVSILQHYIWLIAVINGCGNFVPHPFHSQQNSEYSVINLHSLICIVLLNLMLVFLFLFIILELLWILQVLWWFCSSWCCGCGHSCLRWVDSHSDTMTAATEATTTTTTTTDLFGPQNPATITKSSLRDVAKFCASMTKSLMNVSTAKAWFDYSP